MLYLFCFFGHSLPHFNFLQILKYFEFGKNVHILLILTHTYKCYNHKN